MEKQTLGIKIAELRKAKGMTQLQLAQEIQVTDKAVSKWERDLSLPDIQIIAKLAETLDVSVDELMQSKSKDKVHFETTEVIVDTALKGVGMAMGIAVVVLSVLNEIDIQSAISMLGIGLVSISILLLKDK